MKKIYYLIFIIGSLLLAVNSCKIDNYPYPNAKVFGAIRDSIGGGLVETDMNTGSQIGVQELGIYADNPVRKTWVVMQSGEYRNNLVYANDYKFDFTSCNFFPPTPTLTTIKPGDNQLDFSVTPFIRIKNCSITLNTTTNKVVATFTLEPGRPFVRVAKVSLYAWSDMYVGELVKKNLADKTGNTQSFAGNGAVINPATVYTLSIDLNTNQSTTNIGFGVHRNYYFRVGAIASTFGTSNVGTIRTNYVPYVVIAL